MARITKDYDTHTKEDLLAEAGARKIEGVNAGSLKADIVAALELNDEPAQPPAPLPKLKASPIPQIPVATELPATPSDDPKDEDFTDGVFKKKSDGEDYALAIKKDALSGRTHYAKNSAHFWNGTEGDFDEQFSKK